MYVCMYGRSFSFDKKCQRYVEKVCCDEAYDGADNQFYSHSATASKICSIGLGSNPLHRCILSGTFGLPLNFGLRQ